MPKETEDRESGLQRGLQQPAPIGPSGPPDGPAAPEAADVPEAPKAPAGPASLHVGQAAPPEAAPSKAAIQAAAIGEPDSLPPTWCKVCKAEVKPYGKGKCPRCHTFLKHNFVQRKHPVNVLRRDHLLAKYVRDYRPTTQRLQSMCEQFAGVTEQLETLKAGSQEHKRLVELSQLLGDALEAARPPAPSLPTDHASLTNDQLIERTTTILRGLLELRDDAKRSAGMRDGYCPPDGVDGSPYPEGATTIITEDGVEGLLLGVEDDAPPCLFCHQRPSRCEEIKATQLDAWQLLHWLDPSEVDRRAKAATAEMIESIRRQRS